MAPKRVLVQRSMGPRLIIVGNIGAYDPAQVRFPEHDDVVQALPADRANEPLRSIIRSRAYPVFPLRLCRI